MMILLSISGSLLAFVLTMILFYSKGKTIDTISRRLDLIRKRNRPALDDEFEKPFFQRVILPLYNSIIKLLIKRLKLSSSIPVMDGKFKQRTSVWKLVVLNFRSVYFNHTSTSFVIFI